MIKAVRSNLQYKLVLGFLLVLLLSLGLMTWYNSMATGAALREVETLRQTQLISTNANDIELALQNGRTDLLFLTQTSEILTYANSDTPNPEDVEILFHNFLLQAGGTYHGICLLDVNGFETTCIHWDNGDASPVLPEELTDRIDSNYFNGALSQRAIPGERSFVYVSDVDYHVSDEAEIKPIIHYSTILQRSDGYVVAVLDLQLSVQRLLATYLTHAEHTHVYVIDHTGRYLFVHDENLADETLKSDAPSIEQDLPESGDVILSQPEGSLWGPQDKPGSMLVFRRIRPEKQTLQWTLIYETPLSFILQPVFFAQRINIAIALILGTITTGVVFLFTYRIVQPIRALATAARQLEAQKPDVTLPKVHGSDEIGVLISVFGSMTQQVQSLVKDLEGRIHALETTQHALHESETRFTRTFEIAPIAMAITRYSDGTFLDFNESYLQLVGYSAGELKASTARELKLWVDNQLLLFALDYLKENMYVKELETQLRTKSGEIRNALVSLVLIDIEDEPHILATAIDITERKRSQEKLARYAMELDGLRQISLEVGSTLQLEDVLDRVLEHLQPLVPYTSASIFLNDNGKLFMAASCGLPPEFDIGVLNDPIANKHAFKHMENVMQPVVVADVLEYKSWIFVPGTEHIRSWMGVPLEYAGKLLGMLNFDHEKVDFYTPEHARTAMAVARQVAPAIENAQLYREIEARVAERTRELHEMEQKSQAILNAIPDLVFRIDGDGTYLDFRSQNSHELFVSPDKIIGSNIKDSFPAAFSERMLDYIHRTLRFSELQTFSYELTTPHLGEQHFECRMVKINDDEVLAIVRNMSQEARLQAQKDRFIANAAHELKTPLAVLMTKIYLIKKQPEQLNKHLLVLNDVVENMKQLIDNMLDMSRFERGVIELNREVLDLREVISQVVVFMESKAQEKDLLLKHTIPNIPVWVDLDRHRMIQVLSNLVSNAINYTESGSIHISIVTEESWIHIDVTDTGQGIPDQYLPDKIFEPFNRAHHKATKTGTGLGLAISREIVELHGGKIQVTSEVGVGSTFTVVLPANVSIEAEAF